jgi:hypothetical protein
MKRRTDENKWTDPWFRSLSVANKLAYLYLLDACDAAGVLDRPEQFPAPSRRIGEETDWDALQALLGDRLIVLESGKWWLCEQIAFQCPGGLSPTSKVHSKARKSVIEHGLFSLLDGRYRFDGCDSHLNSDTSSPHG